MPESIRQHLIFEGTVQNVGFRYEINRLARQIGISGWVMNRADGTVEAVVQGTPQAIQTLLDALAECRHIHIAAIHKAPCPIVEGEIGFITRFI
jgi:acylphosphatase